VRQKFWQNFTESLLLCASFSLFIKLSLNSAFGSALSRPLEALNKRRFLGAFGPMVNFKRVSAYKNVHKAKLRFSHPLKLPRSPVTAACRHHSNNLYLTGTSGGAQRDRKRNVQAGPL
jgi:hypothetical protein